MLERRHAFKYTEFFLENYLPNAIFFSRVPLNLFKLSPESLWANSLHKAPVLIVEQSGSIRVQYVTGYRLSAAAGMTKMSSILCLGAFYTNQSRKRRNVLFSDQTKSYVSKLATFTKQTGIKVTPPLRSKSISGYGISHSPP